MLQPCCVARSYIEVVVYAFLQVPRALREGPRFQAMLPAFAGHKPAGKEEGDKRCGRHVSADDSMAAAAIEKMRADALPFQAVSDPEFHRADGEACLWTAPASSPPL